MTKTMRRRIRASAAPIGQTLTTQEVSARVEMLGGAAEHPQVVAACQTADCSAELHRAAVLLELRLAGFDDALATATATSAPPCRMLIHLRFWSV